MNCKDFRDRIFLLQAEELPEAERLDCQSHLDACSDCGARLRFEEAALGELRARLPRSAAPPGLEDRIRFALRATQARTAGAPWYRAAWLPVVAAAAVLALLLLVPQLRNERPAGPVPISSRTVLVVDLDCDRAGKSLEDQRRCAHPLHVNALKLGDGSYWTMDADPAEFRYLMLDARERGQTLRIGGRLLPGTNVIRLESVERFDARRDPRSPLPRVLPAMASGAR
jgi:hypothetical protein